MSVEVTGNFRITTWDEEPYDQIAGQAKLTRATVGMTWRGGVEGEGTTVYLMVYREDESASYVFLQRVVGQIAGRAGGFVVQGSGAYEDGVASGAFSVVPGSGAGDLTNLRGQGDFTSTEERGGTFTLAYDLD